MRGCERGAGSADRAPAHAQPRRWELSRHSEDITRHSEDITRHSEDITKHAKEVIKQKRHTRKALISCSAIATLKHRRDTIIRQDEKAITIHSREAIGRSREGITEHSEEATLGQNRKAITTQNCHKSIPLEGHRKRDKVITHHHQCHVKRSRVLRRRSREDTRRNREGTRRGGDGILPRRTRGGAILLCVLLLMTLRGSGGSASLGAQLVCARAPLTEKQRALCRASPAAVAVIATGLRMAYAECRAQLSGRRWNCSGVGDATHFAHVMPLASREAAYTYAITSAGVTHALSAACARGDLPACGCSTRRRSVPGEQWEWGGASAARCGEAAYGARLARRFLDARELERDARAVMNLHNNRLGRKMVKELVRRECRCHGVSGSCAVRTCWRALPSLRALGLALTDRYRRARLVTPIERGTSVDGRVNIQLVVKRPRQPSGSRLARKNELVFLAPSPTYCEPEPAAGSLGTHARICNNTSRGEDGCESLCCGRGYSTVRRTERVQCRCQFQWCCRVRCHSCLTRTEQHVCN